jgi:RNA polymerase sigma-70 factor (ECF subfamily)
MGITWCQGHDESDLERARRERGACPSGAPECGCFGEDPDTWLMARLAGGEEAAFDQLFRRNADRAYQIAIRFLSTPQDAEDVAQEALLQVFAARSRWKPTAKFTTWLYRIVVNLSLKRLRKSKSTATLALGAPSYEEGPSDRELPAPQAAEPEHVLMEKELAEVVVKAIHTLPPNQRRAVTLHRFEGLSYAEIATAMGCSVSAVEALLHRAKQSLKKRLAPWVGVPEPRTGDTCVPPTASPDREASNDDL